MKSKVFVWILALLCLANQTKARLLAENMDSQNLNGQPSEFSDDDELVMNNQSAQNSQPVENSASSGDHEFEDSDNTPINTINANLDPQAETTATYNSESSNTSEQLQQSIDPPSIVYFASSFPIIFSQIRTVNNILNKRIGFVIEFEEEDAELQAKQTIQDAKSSIEFAKNIFSSGIMEDELHILFTQTPQLRITKEEMLEMFAMDELYYSLADTLKAESEAKNKVESRLDEIASDLEKSAKEFLPATDFFRRQDLFWYNFIAPHYNKIEEASTYEGAMLKNDFGTEMVSLVLKSKDKYVKHLENSRKGISALRQTRQKLAECIIELRKLVKEGSAMMIVALVSGWLVLFS